jgi:O-acetyl-ADP-ribose deacetylase (regulator of RNase III)
MQVVEKDLLSITTGIIMHQTNTLGVMGAGVALAIKEKYPQVFRAYQNVCMEPPTNMELLGKFQIICLSDNPPLYIVNVFGQAGYGRGKQTSYDAVDEALRDLQEFVTGHGLSDLSVCLPYKMGCDRAGGNWNIYSAIVDAYFPNAIACKLPVKEGVVDVV